MEAVEHQGKSLTYLTVHPDNYRSDAHYPLIILLHGFGANMNDLAGLTPAIDREGYAYACPNAPVAFDIGPGMVGYGWGAIGGQGNPEEPGRIEEMLQTFFEEVMEQYQISPGQAILGGFSQGAGMTYRCGLGRPDLFAGLVALSGSRADWDELKDRLPPQRTQPIFIAHGAEDPVSPVERARKAREFLEAEGYSPQYKEYGMGHEITPEVMNDLVPWIHEVLPPLPLE